MRHVAARIALALGILTAACAREESGTPTNLLLVTLDSVRPERFEHPERYSALPLSLAHFREESVRFTRCISTAPGTLPAAASILTGRYPRELGFPAPDRRLPEDVPTLAELLGRAGFDTAGFVAPFSLRPRSGIGRGFAKYEAPGAYRVEDYDVTDRARSWLREPERLATPWFLWVHMNAAHGPYAALETPFLPLNFFYKAQVPVPREEDRRLDDARSSSGRGGVPAYQRLNVPPTLANYRPLYDARVRVGDWFANELRHVLKLTGQYRDTVIVVVGTHGEALGENGIEFDHGENLYPEVLSVPLWLRVPGRSAADVSRIVSHVDLVPTLLEVLGQPPAPVSGRDMLAPGEADDARVVFSELLPPLGAGAWTSASRGDLTLVRTETAALELFRGPDRVPDSARVTEMDALRRALEDYERRPLADVPRVEMAERDTGRLEALGYVVSRFE